MSDKTIYDKLILINLKTNDIKQTLVDYELTTPDEATLENLPIIIGEFLEKSGGINPYERLYMQRTSNETSMIGLFAYTPNIINLDLGAVNTSKVTDMSYMFYSCKASYLDLSSFDMSKVTKTDFMFSNCTSQININGWDTSSLTNATCMFQSFSNNNKYLDLSVLDFSNVTSASSMFDGCNIDYVDIRNTNLNLAKLKELPFKSVKGTVLDLSNYDITGLTSTYNLCYFCGCPTIDLTNWKTTEVTNMKQTFYYISSAEKIIMPDWDMTNVTTANASQFFYNCSKLNYIDLSRSNDDTITKIASLVPAKTLAAYGQILIPVDSSQAAIDALIAKYWKPVGPRIDMASTELSTELDEIKPGKTTKLYYGNSVPWYGNDISVEYVSSDESIATIDKDTMMVISTGIEGTTEITARIVDTGEIISEPKVLSVSETDNYPNVIKFRGTSTPASNNYIYVNGTSSSNRVLLSKMNYNSASGIYTYDVGAPITSIQFNGYGGPTYANTCTELVKINTSNITSMEEMFSYCDKLTELDLSSFDTSKVTNMAYMFDNCSYITSLDLSNFDISNTTNTLNMFLSCNSLHTLRLDNCNNNTINRIIKSYNFPTGTIEGVTRKIYCKEENAAGLTPPKNWVFEYIE